MENLFYCHNCYNIFHLTEGVQKCNFCFCEIIEQIQDEEDQIIETDSLSTPIMESSALNQNTNELVFVAQSATIQSLPTEKPNVSSQTLQSQSNLTFPFHPQMISASLSIKLDSSHLVDSTTSTSNEIHEIASLEDNSQSNESPKKFSQNKSFFQIQIPTRLPELFRTKSKFDKLMNKVSLQSNNFSIRDFCSICLKNYQMKDYVRITQCGHKYHEGCLKSWMKVKKECPICRSQFKL